MAISPDGKQVATGSYAGVVNIFKFEQSKLEDAPLKSIMNLTTAITDLKFNSTSQILGICSKWKKNAIKLIHVPSYTVF